MWPIILLLFISLANCLFPCLQAPCPCFPVEDRLEVRKLSPEQRGKVAAAFRSARHLVPKAAWSQSGKTMCLLINSLDATLRPIRFPFWDSRIEERMANPQDSFLFLGRFFPDKNARRRRRSKNRRSRSDLMMPLSMSSQLFTALKSGRHGQLLSFMHSVGLQMRRFVNDTCDELCPGKSEFLSCSQDKCWSKLRAGAICSENSLTACYNSICINNICSVPSKSSKDEQLVQYEVIGDETLSIVRLSDNEEKHQDGNVEGSGMEDKHSNLYYEVNTSTTAPTISTITNYVLDSLEFNATFDFPTVYVPISIMKTRHIRRHLHNVEEFYVTSKGANLPTGYTQNITGFVTNSSRAYVRILDPKLSTLAIEAIISVKLNGKECEPTCLIQKENYKPCKNKIRLSRYAKLSDPIKWYKNPSNIPTKWTGSGYYKKPTYDYMLFRCM